MPEEILINFTARETRVAVLENGVLQELMIERASRRGLTGNIYMGKVSRVLPGMQAAFIEIGIARTAFLHASDIASVDSAGEDGLSAESDIRNLLREGQLLPVQVMKDPIGSKGARLTTKIAIPSRFLVALPTSTKLGVSARIEDEDERERLKAALESIIPAEHRCGYIIRTVAEGVGPEALHADMMFLEKLWKAICDTAATAEPGQLIHEDLSLAVRVIRDIVGLDVERVQVDAEKVFDRLKHFAGMFMPEIESTIELYRGRRPILDLYGVEDDIKKALNRKISMKSGGYLIFDQTEAMTTIDVNTGGFVGHRNLEDTIFRTNLEAAVTIARQLRLRNLGGIIIIDFIDMEEKNHRNQVRDALETALAFDHARTQISEHSALGLVEMTRKRTRESLEHIMCNSCPACHGNGFLKTPETVCYEIFREILRQHRQFKFEELVVMAHQDVVELLLDEESSGLAELEELTGKPIRLQAETMFAPDRFDVVLM
ncbi:MAG: ribonuclease G [Gammaproteobacteria bacterium]|jgi:ribonuclease G|nr:ribonuclease G [Chromatiales bacterium]MDP6674150.1 ribonuclease G [Gammaproteobacteria bacterium]